MVQVTSAVGVASTTLSMPVAKSAAMMPARVMVRPRLLACA